MAYYTVAAVAVGVVCALAYTLYASWNSSSRQRTRTSTAPPRPSATTKSSEPLRSPCGVCHRLVHTGMFLSCGHQFHKSCLRHFLNNGDSQVVTFPRTCIVCDSAYYLKEISNDSDENCSICLFAVEGDSTILSCGHEFHNQCVIQMLEHPASERRCPNCRMQLGARDLRDVYGTRNSL